MSVIPSAEMPGSVSMSRLKVYDTPTPDGQIGGTPHVHLVCTETYFVLSGSGAVEMIDSNGFAKVALNQHDALTFTPGTIHRLINSKRDLEILVIMGNSGLPEHGDNVVTFTDEWLSTDDAYAGAMRVNSVEDAYQRRDRGVQGFLQLKSAFETSLSAGQDALQRFYAQANARTAHQQERWRKIVQTGTLAQAQQSLEQIDNLQSKNTAYLSKNLVHHIPATDTQTPGFCGHLSRYFDASRWLPEGTQET